MSLIHRGHAKDCAFRAEATFNRAEQPSLIRFLSQQASWFWTDAQQTCKQVCLKTRPLLDSCTMVCFTTPGSCCCLEGQRRRSTPGQGIAGLPGGIINEGVQDFSVCHTGGGARSWLNMGLPWSMLAKCAACPPATVPHSASTPAKQNSSPAQQVQQQKQCECNCSSRFSNTTCH